MASFSSRLKVFKKTQISQCSVFTEERFANSLGKTRPFVLLNVFINGLEKGGGGGAHTKFVDYAGLCSEPL